jgi:hypothetical protein
MQHMVPVTNLALGRILAMLGREQEALSAFGEAESAALSMGMRPDAWKAMAATADLLQKAGDHDLAQEKRTAAHDIVKDIAAGFTDEELKSAYIDATL